MNGLVDYRAISGFPEYRCGSDGSISRFIKGRWREMNLSRDRDGYLRVYLRSEGKKKSFGVHRVVLDSFVGQCPNGLQCRHLDGDKANNRLENLRWGTARENQEDSLRHGVRCTLTRGPSAPRSKLTISDIREVCRLRDLGYTQSEIAEKFGVSQVCVSLHLAGQWRDLMSETNF